VSDVRKERKLTRPPSCCQNLLRESNTKPQVAAKRKQGRERKEEKNS